MQIIRGTTPTIEITVKSEIDFSTIQQVWVYITQQGKPKVDKFISDAVLEPENSKISVRLSQEDTLALKSNENVHFDTIFQIRLLLNDGSALATVGTKIKVFEIYKGGVIQ